MRMVPLLANDQSDPPPPGPPTLNELVSIWYLLPERTPQTQSTDPHPKPPHTTERSEQRQDNHENSSNLNQSWTNLNLSSLFFQQKASLDQGGRRYRWT